MKEAHGIREWYNAVVGEVRWQRECGRKMLFIDDLTGVELQDWYNVERAAGKLKMNLGE